jgi:putative FmdB family regulatory protein
MLYYDSCRCPEEFLVPLYEYLCGKCGHLFEKIERHSASLTKKCPKCGRKAKRTIARTSMQFKGSGWYVTDYGGKQTGREAPKSDSATASAETKKSDSTETAAKAEPAKTESTPKKNKD